MEHITWRFQIAPGNFQAWMLIERPGQAFPDYAVIHRGPQTFDVCRGWWDRTLATFPTLEDAQRYAQVAAKLKVTGGNHDKRDTAGASR